MVREEDEVNVETGDYEGEEKRMGQGRRYGLKVNGGNGVMRGKRELRDGRGRKWGRGKN